jgi:heme-degrading monooxygenase HmoA
MTTIFIKHTVEDFEKWKAGFDAHATTREEYGSPEDYRLFREAETPNEVVIIAEWESPEAFRRFMKESDVEEKMGELGVLSEPEVHILEESESKTAEQPPGATST